MLAGSWGDHGRERAVMGKKGAGERFLVCCGFLTVSQRMFHHYLASGVSEALFKGCWQ